jgi:uncharacterized integral membrane protein (TIGR00698 family)
MNGGASPKTWGASRFADSLDSLEGVPDWFEPRVMPELRSAGGQRLHGLLDWLGTLMPGLVLAAALAVLGKAISDWLGAAVWQLQSGSPISPILFAVLLGLLVRNLIGVPKAYEPGLRLAIKTVLRIGIVLLGLKLSIWMIAQIGLVALPVIVLCIAIALLAVAVISRAIGLPRRLATLIAVGTGICGVSAIAATAPAIEATDDETSYAVACITLFGLMALFAYPFLAHTLFENDARQVGLFLGTAIHDTSQVAGAGLMYKQQYGSDEVLKTAVAVKLMRNVLMSLLIPVIAIVYHRSAAPAGETRRQKWLHAVPLFVVGFMVMVCLRSIGDMGDRSFGILDPATWQQVLSAADTLAIWCLGIAMAAIGLGTGLSRMMRLGWRPLCGGLAAAVLVGGMSVALIHWLV